MTTYQIAPTASSELDLALSPILKAGVFVKSDHLVMSK